MLVPTLLGRFARRLLGATAALVALTQAVPAAAAEPTNSGLDARLFYQLVIGELELRAGQAGTAYQVMLDAARRSHSEQLYRRAVEIALQSRAGEQGLAAARAWREALPESIEAHRFVLQLLLAMNRAPEMVEPLRSLLEITPAAERPARIVGLPRMFGRAADRAQAPALLESALQPYADAPATRAAVQVALGRAWLFAQEPAKALEFAQRALTLDPAYESAVLLAIELVPVRPSAQALVTPYLERNPGAVAVRLLYVRALGASQRYADAVVELESVVRTEPNLAQPWLTLGALQLELKHPERATTALQRYVQLVEAGAPPAATPRAGDDSEDQPADAPASLDQALTQAWLLLSQAAEQQGDFKAAEAWLARVESPQRALEVQTRRASILARQGKLAEARALIRRAPEQTAADARAKLLAEVQLLRDAKRWADAHELLAQANQKTADDADLLYEQSMMAEKLDRMDEMERLLRRVIALKPDYQHAYNALGFSLAERNLRLPEAKTLVAKALELSPGDPFITDSAAWVEYRLGNREEALRLLRQAYGARPDAEIAAHLGEVLWVSGQRDEARRILRDARTRDAENDVLRETLARLRVDL
ncbi:MAG: tetratricopeptide repeat protein [Burkholderiaceae bacterium]